MASIKKYDFDVTHDFEGLFSNKWNFRKEKVGREDVIPMWVADMDFKTAESIQTALVQRAERGIYGYTSMTREYTDAVINWFKRRHNWAINDNEIITTPGVISALHIAINVLSIPHDYILIQPPTYHPFFQVIKKTKRKVLENPLIRTSTGHYEIDFDDFEHKIVQYKPKAFILCNPQNPTGKVYSKAELLKLGEICCNHQVVIIADEIHSDIVFSEAVHTPFATIAPECTDNAIICTAPSKTFNMAGLQNSNIIIPNRKIRDKFREALDRYGFPRPGLFSIVATQTAYNTGESWLEAVLQYIEGNRDYALQRFSANLPQLKVFRPQGTYFLWVDFNHYGLTNEQLEAYLINDAGVWFNQGYIFGSQGSGFVRINIACPQSIVAQALTQIENSIIRIPGKGGAGGRW